MYVENIESLRDVNQRSEKKEERKFRAIYDTY
jgi:hypothetical protein